MTSAANGWTRHGIQTTVVRYSALDVCWTPTRLDSLFKTYQGTAHAVPASAVAAHPARSCADTEQHGLLSFLDSRQLTLDLSGAKSKSKKVLLASLLGLFYASLAWILTPERSNVSSFGEYIIFFCLGGFFRFFRRFFPGGFSSIFLERKWEEISISPKSLDMLSAPK